MPDINPYEPPDKYEALPDDPHSGTRLVLWLFALPFILIAGWIGKEVASGIAKGLVEYDASRRIGYVAGGVCALAVIFLAMRIINQFNQPGPLTPEQEDEIEPDDYDMPADWEED